MGCFVPLSDELGLGIRCNKEVFAIWKARPFQDRRLVRGSRRAHCKNDDVTFEKRKISFFRSATVT
jgi:hypothetical protein